MKPKGKRKVKAVRAWAVVNPNGSIRRVLLRQPRETYYIIGTQRGLSVIPVTITLRKK